MILPSLALFVFAALLGWASSPVQAGSELVTVAKIMSNDDKGIIVRPNGEAYLIEKGVGCLSFWKYEGRQALVLSPGSFLGVGSELILPNDGQKCRIWDSKELGQWSEGPSRGRRPGRSPAGSMAMNCIDGHSLASVSSNGQVIILLDGSIWEIDIVDAIQSMLWLPADNLLICGNRILNVRDGKSATATRIK